MNPQGQVPDRQHWQRLEQALDELLALPPEQRRPRALTLCGRDTGLHEELLSLLQAEESLGRFMEPVAVEAPVALPSLTPQQRVGAFRILRLIGRGGMGEVYLAERADGAYEQRVALKLIAAPLAHRPEQLQAERQILAQLEHPGIARLIDGGVAEDGRPYMAVEYVEGVDLLQHCTREHLALAPRIELFARICEAVAYAHRHLVIHRDLKPGNILVTADGQPKLLDFGIAKLLRPGGMGSEAGRTLHITPTHAAPEQLQGGLTTTATDVHALGVILYELLSGAPPWQLSQLPLAQAVSRVLQDEPPPPSAAARTSSPVAARELRGDLDQIVLKALRKAPEARYASAAELLEDLRRYQRHEPVAAHGYGIGYVASRFIRRHRLAVASAGFALLALLGGLAASLWFYFDARAARYQAQRAAATTQAVSDFLNRDLLASADIAKRPTRDIGLRELLDKAAAEAGTRFAAQPEAAARVHESLGDSYFNLTLYEPARLQYLRALELHTQLHGRNAAATLAIVAKLANVSGYAGKTTEALPLFREAITAYEARGDHPRAAQLRMEHSGLLFTAGEFVQGTAQMQALLEREDQRPTLSVEDRLDLQTRYGSQLAWLGDYDRAERELRAALAGRMSLLGADQMPTAVSQLGLGGLLVELARLDEAAAEIEPAVATVRRWVGPDDAFLALAENTLAKLRLEQGRAREAEALLGNTLRIRTLVFGADSSFTAWTTNQLAEMLQRQGRLREALALTEQALPIAEQVDGPLNPWTTRQRLIQAAILRELGERERAWNVLEAITPQAFAGLPQHHPFLARQRQEQGLLAELDGDTARARAALTEALGIYEMRLGSGHPRTQDVRRQLADMSP